MATNNYLIPYEAIPPIEIVADEIKARGISQKEFAERLGIKPSNLNRMFKTGAAITIPFAQKLETALGISADNWLKMQANYERDKATMIERDEKEASAVVCERSLSGLINFKALYKALGIKESAFAYTRIETLKSMMGESPEIFIKEGACVAFKKSDKANADEKNCTTWLTLALLAAKADKPEISYSIGVVDEAASEISKSANDGSIKEERIKSILNSHGISYSVVKKLDKVPVDAISTNKFGYPSIIVTHRYDDMAKLVFDVLHELGHIKMHMDMGKVDSFVSYGDYSVKNILETEANKYAQDKLIPESVWNNILCGQPKDIRMHSILAYLKDAAEKFHINYNILSWRYKYETENYALRGKAQRIS